MPRSKERFEKYLYMLQGDAKDEMLLPIASFNPMGKELAAEKMEKLISLHAEYIAENTIAEINTTFKRNNNRTIRVALNLVDDVEGSWSDHYTTDYKSKFETESYLKRDFCTPLFWTSETVTEEIIMQRVREYLFRTLYKVHLGEPETLHDCLEQEIYVHVNSGNKNSLTETGDFSNIERFFSENAGSVDYNLKFNFFYGDQASKSLAYATFGIRSFEGFDYAKYIAEKR